MVMSLTVKKTAAGALQLREVISVISYAVVLQVGDS